MPDQHYGKWRARWLDESGARRSKNFDTHRDAKIFEGQMRTHVAEIRAGLRAAVPAPRSFVDLKEQWLTTRALQKRSKRDDESILRRHLTPEFGSLLLKDIDVAAVERFVASRTHLSKKTIANHLTLLIAMLNYARDLKWIVEVPKFKKPRVRTHSKDFLFFRSPADIRRFMSAAREETEGVAAMYAAAIFTGARAGELAALRWDDVNFDRRLITIQRSIHGPTKGDEVHYVPILDPLLPILRSWRLRNPLAIVFPNEVGGMHGESSRVFQEILQRVLTRAEFEKVERRGKLRHAITFHSLRHTFASHWVMSGGSLFKLQKILGHQSIVMTERYSHLAPDRFVEDHARLGSTSAFDFGALARIDGATAEASGGVPLRISPQ
ncbi:MAG: tyrosine-type recombinase/integrase [Polyangiaceae bacterium]